MNQERKVISKLQGLFEKNHLIIQTIMFIIFVFFEVASDFISRISNLHIFILLTYMCGLLFTLVIHFTIIHDKINNNLVYTKMINGHIFEVNSDYKQMDSFFDSVKESIFISGIALNMFIGSYYAQLSKLLESGKKVIIIMCGAEGVEKNAEHFFGKPTNDNIKTVVDYIISSLDKIKKIENYEKYIKNNQLEIRFINTTISTSIMGSDLNFGAKTTREKRGLIKILFYCFGSKQTDSCPNIFVKRENNEKWFSYFRNIAYNQYLYSKIIKLEEINTIEKKFRSIADINM